ncbi:IQ motif [Macleaya cordata]|uniref:IQ motif n=1 Tax=Macleaya cordata TaxID=56857 RepID=A0A200QGF3_MACCD|nr:IQ motif [Macleaya cordata]
MSGFNISELVQEARKRWLKPAEVLFILQNHENHQLTEAAPQKPPSGSLFLFNKRVLRFFRKDGHDWRKKKDGRTVGEAHERLKVGNVEALNCYYAHGEQNPNFQRRSYWMLDQAYEHIVLVHYREITEGRYSAGSTSHLSSGSSTLSPDPSLYTSNPGSSSAVTELYEPYRSSFSPGSVEVSSELMVQNNVVDHLGGNDGSGEFSMSNNTEVCQALRRLEEQLSLNDSATAEISSYYRHNGQSNDLGVLYSETRSNRDNLAASEYGSEFIDDHQYFSEGAGMLDDSESSLILQHSGDNREQHHQQFRPEYKIERKDSPFWKEMLELCSGSSLIDRSLNTMDGSEKPLSSELVKIPAYPAEEPGKWNSQWLDLTGEYSENNSNSFPTSEDNLSMQLSAARQFLLGSDNPVSPTSVSLLHAVENSKVSIDSSGLSTHEANPDNYNMWYDQRSQTGILSGAESSLTLTQKQKFNIREISPGWGYAAEDTKVIIIGSFLCDPSESAWNCMFGDIEVPAQIIQQGVLRCQAPPHISGKVTLCITSGNREPCSEIREFEYMVRPKSCSHCDLPKRDATRSTEELLLLVRFAQMLLSDPVDQKADSVASGNVLKKSNIDEDQWEYMIEALLLGSGTPFSTMDWLLQKLLKDKLQQWLSLKYQEGDTPNCYLSKREQGIIHIVAGLGFEWALNPILHSGISINFRDVNGWTALHWAARFGREKMVAALIAAGALAEAVTDPTSQDPAGKTAGSIAAASGHKGLAGYLSEVALTSHLSSLTIEESEISKVSAAVEAERTIESISSGRLGATEDQISLKDSLSAVRNAAQAAARIQSAFRAHSFRRRQQKEAATVSDDEYGFTPGYIHGLSAASKFAFRGRDHKFDKAALSIQKKYRGWKGRKDFLALRQKVVRIQAHVRGHQVRKKYKVILWAVGVLDKVVLRWRRKGTGLRGFKPESESIDESEDEDILKVFRKQKVDVAIEEAVSQVMSMVESPEARQQYRRMLDSYWEAKAMTTS